MKLLASRLPIHSTLTITRSRVIRVVSGVAVTAGVAMGDTRNHVQCRVAGVMVQAVAASGAVVTGVGDLTVLGVNHNHVPFRVTDLAGVTVGAVASADTVVGVGLARVRVASVVGMAAGVAAAGVVAVVAIPVAVASCSRDRVDGVKLGPVRHNHSNRYTIIGVVLVDPDYRLHKE